MNSSITISLGSLLSKSFIIKFIAKSEMKKTIITLIKTIFGEILKMWNKKNKNIVVANEA